MADSYRPLSRHSVKIGGESSSFVQTVLPMDAAIHTEYGEVNVYETTVRPKSRRAEGHTRPKSAYNNRFRREGSRVSVTTPRDVATPRDVTTPRDQPDERPRTSRGRRDSETSHSGDVTSAELTSSRPKSGYGHRRHDVTSQHDVIDVTDRPQTRRERRVKHEPERRASPPAGPMLQRERTFYEVNMTSSQRGPEDDRPRTRQGRTSQMSDYGGSQPSTPRNTSDPAERPRTSHGRRRQHSQGDDYSGTEASPRVSTERPISRAGRRAPTANSNDSESVAGGAADVLVVEDGRPHTSRGRRRHIPIDLSYMANQHNPSAGVSSPSPPPRPPTGRRPKSSRRQKATKPPASPAYDYDRQTTTTPVHISNRPLSSSLNRFAPLPAIGSRQDSHSSYHIHIPHAGETTGNLTGETTGNLTEHAQRLNLQDSASDRLSLNDGAELSDSNNTLSLKPEKEEASDQDSLYPPLHRHIELPPEPAPTGDRVILAIKLPDGARVQRGFRPEDQLLAVMNFAELSAQLDFSHCELVCDVPRQVYKDLRVLIRDSGLQNRTVLHVQVPDEP